MIIRRDKDSEKLDEPRFFVLGAPGITDIVKS